MRSTRRCTTSSSVLITVLTYLFLVAAMILYLVSIFAFPDLFGGSIVELFTNSTGKVELKLGYTYVCVFYPPSDADNTSNSNMTQSKCTGSLDTTSQTPSELAQELIQGMNMTNVAPSAQYNTWISSLIHSAGALRALELFDDVPPIAAFSLLIISGVVFLVPMFFNSLRRGAICNVLLLVAALCAGYGLMLAYGSMFSLLQVQTALSITGTGPLSLPGMSNLTGPVFVQPGRAVDTSLKYGLGMAATSVALMALLALVRRDGQLHDSPDVRLLVGDNNGWNPPLIPLMPLHPQNWQQQRGGSTGPRRRGRDRAH